MTDKRLLLTTIASRAEADKLATALVERRLAACVNIAGPVSSVYRWKGAVERADEYMLIIKSTAALIDSIKDAVCELHPYEVPELISFSIDSGLGEYLDWVSSSVAE